ncbi:MAG: peptide deformylase [Kiloniellales bacterium]|nr:peptide deformylase [Kiloniellales bacterium]
MAILKIARMGHPVLARAAEPVEDPTAAETRRLVADMIETMYDAPGTGLAAPQVHVAKRILVFFVSAGRAALEDGRAKEGAAGGGEAVPLTALINPEVEILTEETALGWEGCLSLPGLAGEVPRYTHIRYRGLTPQGQTVEREARGFHARVVQHEFDHLDGILYPQRMTDLSKLVFTSEMRHRAQQEEDDDRELAEA